MVKKASKQVKGNAKKKATKRTTKDLSPRKSSSVKGGMRKAGGDPH